jgi:hypothetical protein
MPIKQLTITMAAAALFAVVGSASGSAQENCGRQYQRVTEAYQMQSPRYGEMLNHYNARCLSGSSVRPGWEGDRHHRYDNDRRGYDNDRRGHDYERGNRG